MGKNIVQTANRVIDEIASQTDSVMLMCSLGKDSLVTLDMIYPRFRRIVCVFMYFVQGLEHIDRWINWCKNRYPRIEFVEIPHWNLTYILKYGMYSTVQPDVKILKLADVIAGLRAKYGIHYCFLGMKKADGMNRNLMLRGYEKSNYINNGLVYPLADWNQREILSYMKQKRLPEPVRYSLKASSGVGFNTDCLKWMQQYFPNDLAKIVEVFPACERELYEDEFNSLSKEEVEDRWNTAKENLWRAVDREGV